MEGGGVSWREEDKVEGGVRSLEWNGWCNMKNLA